MTAWDDLMKLLVEANPQDLVSLLLPNAKFKYALDKELKVRTVKEDDIDWLKRRFSMLESALEGSWAYKEIVEKGLAQGLEQGRLQNQRQILVDYVEVRFPELTTLAKERAEAIDDLAVLRRMTNALFGAQSPERAQLILLEDQRTNGTLS